MLYWFILESYLIDRPDICDWFEIADRDLKSRAFLCNLAKDISEGNLSSNNVETFFRTLNDLIRKRGGVKGIGSSPLEIACEAIRSVNLWLCGPKAKYTQCSRFIRADHFLARMSFLADVVYSEPNRELKYLLRQKEHIDDQCAHLNKWPVICGLRNNLFCWVTRSNEISDITDVDLIRDLCGLLWTKGTCVVHLQFPILSASSGTASVHKPTAFNGCRCLLFRSMEKTRDNWGRAVDLRSSKYAEGLPEGCHARMRMNDLFDWDYLGKISRDPSDIDLSKFIGTMGENCDS